MIPFLSNRQLAYSIIVVSIILAVGSFLILSYSENIPESSSTTPYRAAIVDQLSQSLPNQTFITEATLILETANFTVDYYPADMVTVDLYRKLPIHRYDLIILRVHSAIGDPTEDPDSFALFTSETYSTSKYQYEQLADTVEHVKHLINNESYFGINSDFVKMSMHGDFSNTAVIAMGCYGTTYESMAKAFIEKGALVYFGWNDLVDITHSDTATLCLLTQLLTQRQTIYDAIQNTVNEVGSDPTYNSNLLCYGPTNAEQTYVI